MRYSVTIASDELNFVKVIYKCLYGVTCLCTSADLWAFFVFVSLIDVSIAMAVALAYYLLFQGRRRWYIDRFVWLLLQSLFALSCCSTIEVRGFLPLA